MARIVVTDAGSDRGKVKVADLDSGRSLTVPRNAAQIAAARDTLKKEAQK